MDRRITVYLLSPKDRRHYKAEWIEPGTRICRSRTTGTSDPDKAETFRADLEYRLNHGLEERFAPLSWDAFEERYFAERIDNLKPRTGDKARTTFRLFAKLARPGKLADIDASMISRFAAARRRQGKAPATVHADLGYLAAALRWAAKMGLRGPVPAIEMPALPRRKRFRTLREADYPRALGALPLGAWQLLMEVAWYTGMRRLEMLLMNWHETEKEPWADLDAARIWIPGPSGKASREDWIPIHPALAAILLPLRLPRGRVILLDLHEDTVTEKFIEFMELAGIKLKLHDVRRSFGTRYASVVPAQVLQRLMRHANIATTMEFYADLDDSLAAHIAKL